MKKYIIYRLIIMFIIMNNINYNLSMRSTLMVGLFFLINYQYVSAQVSKHLFAERNKTAATP